MSSHQYFLDAVDFTDFSLLQISLPTNLDELHNLVLRWDQKLTAPGLLFGHVAPLDGWFLITCMP